MTPTPTPIRWAPKVSQWQIRRLYTTDAQGILDDAQIDAVGWALWERCDSILAVTAAHDHGQVRCPACSHLFARDPASELLACPACGWQLAWAAFHQSYRSKQLYGANATEVFRAYHQAFPAAEPARAKMRLIDQLIHAFHVSLREVGRPAAANLIEGSLAEVIRFLDELTHAGTSAAGLEDARAAWRSTLEQAPWAAPFIPRADTPET